MSQTSKRLDDLMVLDVDDFAPIAASLDGRARSHLLRGAAARLRTARNVVKRFKLLLFIQAFLSETHPRHVAPETSKVVARALVAATRWDDPADRLAAFRALALLLPQAKQFSVVEKTLRPALENGKRDSYAPIRDFAREVTAPGGALDRRVSQDAKRRKIGPTVPARLRIAG
jgi:hypothetical protein